FVRSDTRDTSSTSSAFVMLPVFMWTFRSQLPASRLRLPAWRESRGRLRSLVSPATPTSRLQLVWLEAGSRSWQLSLLVLEVIAERHFGAPGGLRVRFPIGAELVALQRADAEADLPLARDQLDDLHLVAVAHLQLQLLVLPGVLRVVELGHVDQPLDAFRQLDEGAEVGQPDHL